MGQKIKLIALDLDGTLLTDEKKITKDTMHILKRASDQGVIIAIATGRPFMGIPEELRTLDGIRYAMTSNGAKIIDMENHSILMEHLLSADLAVKMLEIGNHYDALQEVYFEDQGYVDEAKMQQLAKYHHNPNMWEYFRTTRKQVPDIMALTKEKHQDMDKVQMLFADLSERDAAWEEIEKIQGVTQVDSLGYNIEINAAGVNKGVKLLELGEKLGIKREEIMACGDGQNDITMIQMVGFGVAMGNAIEAVKKVADYVTDTNEQQGVAKAIKKFILEGGNEC